MATTPSVATVTTSSNFLTVFVPPLSFINPTFTNSGVAWDCQIYFFIDLWPTLPRLAGPLSRGVNLSWITIVITAVYHVMISSMITIEFLLLQLGVYFFGLFLLHLSFGLLVLDVLWSIFGSEFSGSIYFSRFSLFFGIEFVEYHDRTYISHLPLSSCGIYDMPALSFPSNY